MTVETSESFSSISTTAMDIDMASSHRGGAVNQKRMSVFVRILFQYLEKVDKPTLAFARIVSSAIYFCARQIDMFNTDHVSITFMLFQHINQILRDCAKKHKMKDSKFNTLTEAVMTRVRHAVGEAHWQHAEKIHKPLVHSQQKKRTVATKCGYQQNDPVSILRIEEVLRRMRLQRKQEIHRGLTSLTSEMSDVSKFSNKQDCIIELSE